LAANLEGKIMRIAQVAPLYERVPPVCYGGTERVVSYLTEALVEQGHEVTLFASGDSLTQAKLISPCAQSLRLNPDCIDDLAYNLLQLEQVFQRADHFDIVHFHIDYFHYPFSRRQKVPHLTTLHGRLDLADLVPLYREFDDMPVVSISNSQRAPLPWIRWCGTVYHGLPVDLYKSKKERGRYLLFLGRISPEKRPDRAIEIAKRAGMPLKIAAKVDEKDRKYMENEIRPLLDHPLVEFLGEIGDSGKEELLRNAYALLFPIDWAEPFGLVMIEAMACGTPTIAFRGGSVREIITDGLTGYVVETVEHATEALKALDTFDRMRCRSIFEERFSARRMAQDYLQIYQRLIYTDARDTRRRSIDKPLLRPATIELRRKTSNGAILDSAGSNQSRFLITERAQASRELGNGQHRRGTDTPAKHERARDTE
jgi:glycosyltransferase involved in cell wall biosynthesis